LAGILTGLALDGWLDDESPAAAARLNAITGHFSIGTTLFLR